MKKLYLVGLLIMSCRGLSLNAGYDLSCLSWIGEAAHAEATYELAEIIYRAAPLNRISGNHLGSYMRLWLREYAHGDGMLINTQMITQMMTRLTDMLVDPWILKGCLSMAAPLIKLRLGGLDRHPGTSLLWAIFGQFDGRISSTSF